MSAPTTIRVTREHIDQGAPRSEDYCPIALALKDQWDEPVNAVSVLPDGATVYTDDGWYSADTWPEAAEEFVNHFDFEGDVDPFEFAVTWHFHLDPIGDDLMKIKTGTLNCWSCHKPITWGHKADGKPVPLDPGDDPEGALAIGLLDGLVRPILPGDEPWTSERRGNSHLATCPTANSRKNVQA